MKPDYDTLWRRDPKGCEEKAALDLAVALSENASERVVSIEHQAEAVRYVKERGWRAAVDRSVDLGAVGS